MPKFEAIRPGDVLYKIVRRQMGNTTIRTAEVRTVAVQEVDSENRRVMIGGRWVPEFQLGSYRRNKPEIRRTITGQTVLVPRSKKTKE